MRGFEYKKRAGKLFSPEMVSILGRLHEHKGRQELFVEAHTDTLSTLLEIAKIQSTGSSNRIEGIYTSGKRLEELVKGNSAPRNRSEQEIAGYRDVLATIHDSYEHIPPGPNIILQLHRQLYSFAASGTGGLYKNSDNYIAETDASGKEFVRFQPVPAFQTPAATEELCTAFSRELDQGRHDPLLLIPMFILDFLCIHPFNDGNGRMSRLLTLLLYYRSGYIVGKYISIEKLIEDSKDTYYESLGISSEGWHENKNNYAPFIMYYLGVLLKAYNEFEDRLEYLRYRKFSKPDRIRAVIAKKTGRISKKDILEACPDISRITVERT
ncbi:MAG: Fic family protein, partial [Treponema sp.]|nr:Fic family protein [Treponema sp.]